MNKITLMGSVGKKKQEEGGFYDLYSTHPPGGNQDVLALRLASCHVTHLYLYIFTFNGFNSWYTGLPVDARSILSIKSICKIYHCRIKEIYYHTP